MSKEPVDYRGVGNNDPEEYLAKTATRAGKKVGHVPGSNMTASYGDRGTHNDIVYSNRGLETTDEKKLKQQAKPDDRMYTYLE